MVCLLIVFEVAVQNVFDVRIPYWEIGIVGIDRGDKGVVAQRLMVGFELYRNSISYLRSEYGIE